MKKVVFLDVDGVLNTEMYINAAFHVGGIIELKHPELKPITQELIRDDYGHIFCPTACNQLAWIVESTGADIVISSTWRCSGLTVMKEIWKQRNLSGNVIDITPIIRDRSGREFKERAERGNEIKNWLNRNNVDSYCILDDDDDMLEEQMTFFVQTDGMYGLTHKDAIRAIEILNRVDC